MLAPCYCREWAGCLFSLSLYLFYWKWLCIMTYCQSVRSSSVKRVLKNITSRMNSFLSSDPVFSLLLFNSNTSRCSLTFPSVRGHHLFSCAHFVLILFYFPNRPLYLVSSHFGSHLPHFLHIFLSLFCLLSLCSMSSSPFTLLLLQAFTYEADLSRMSSNFEVKIVN